MTWTPILSGVLGGIASMLVTAYVAKRVGRGIVPGQLRFGAFMWGLALVCAVLALAPVAVTLAGHDEDFWPKLGLFLGFGFGAVYCFGEAAGVRGRFDEAGIQFKTPWTGAKDERWEGLQRVHFNAPCGWYVLAFKSGAKVRLSSFLSGHRAALDMAKRQTGLEN